jgi:hypothetical protein
VKATIAEVVGDGDLVVATALPEENRYAELGRGGDRVVLPQFQQERSSTTLFGSCLPAGDVFLPQSRRDALTVCGPPPRTRPRSQRSVASATQRALRKLIADR